jgi:SAM-dependent methyltransferase
MRIRTLDSGRSDRGAPGRNGHRHRYRRTHDCGGPTTRSGRDIEWIVGGAETYPLPEGHYDAIISQMGLMFFTNNAKAFANLARACRAGGRLVGVVWPTRDKISTFRFLFNSVRLTLDRLHIAYQEPPLILGRSRWVTIDMSNSS